VAQDNSQLHLDSNIVESQQKTRLKNLAKNLNKIEDIEGVMNVAFDGIMELTDASYAHIYILDELEHAPYLFPHEVDAKSGFKELEAQFGYRAEGLKVIERIADRSIVVPVPDHETKSLLGVLRLFEDKDDDNETLPLDDALNRDLAEIAAIVASAVQRTLTSQEKMIGESPPMQAIRKQIQQAADTDDMTVLIQGPTGTGKDLAAKVIHRHSSRCDKPFVALSCGGLSGALIESELYGHAKGAFTNADASREGLFEHANGGTLVLEDISAMPVEQQVKLLQVLQEKEIRRVGETKTRKVDVRVIATTNQDLSSMKDTGGFRSDLYYRLNVFRLDIPKLCERSQDILPIAKYFLMKHAPGKRLTRDAENTLMEYSWPGNVRELGAAIESASARTGSLQQMTQDHLPIEVAQPQSASSPSAVPREPYDTPTDKSDVRQIAREAARDVVHEAIEGLNPRPTQPEGLLERLLAIDEFTEAVSKGDLATARDILDILLILDALKAFGGNQAAAARQLKIGRQELRNRIEDYQNRGILISLKPPKFQYEHYAVE
jgi:DNA-binding NtrC family response regulator